MVMQYVLRADFGRTVGFEVAIIGCLEDQAGWLIEHLQTHITHPFFAGRCGLGQLTATHAHFAPPQEVRFEAAEENTTSGTCNLRPIQHIQKTRCLQVCAARIACAQPSGWIPFFDCTDAQPACFKGLTDLL